MTCPICARPADPAYRPFCSRRCADVDLAHWLRGSYAIPATEDGSGDGPEDGPKAGSGDGNGEGTAQDPGDDAALSRRQ